MSKGIYHQIRIFSFSPGENAKWRAGAPTAPRSVSLPHPSEAPRAAHLFDRAEREAKATELKQKANEVLKEGGYAEADAQKGLGVVARFPKTTPSRVFFHAATIWLEKPRRVLMDIEPRKRATKGHMSPIFLWGSWFGGSGNHLRSKRKGAPQMGRSR